MRKGQACSRDSKEALMAEHGRQRAERHEVRRQKQRRGACVHRPCRLRSGSWPVAEGDGNTLVGCGQKSNRDLASSVVKNSSAKARDLGSIPGGELRSHVPRGN